VNYEKVDAPLLMVWRSWQRQGLEGLRRHTALWDVTIREDIAYIGISVYCTEDLSTDPKWQDKVASHELPAGKCSARIPVELVEELAAHPAVTRMRLGRRFRIPDCRRRRGRSS
jgi:hypothetical protein